VLLKHLAQRLAAVLVQEASPRGAARLLQVKQLQAKYLVPREKLRRGMI
jgi:hypothetical protein